MKFVDLKQEKISEQTPEELLKEYYELTESINKLEKRKKELREIIIDNEAGEYEVGKMSLNIEERSKINFDSKKAKEFIITNGGDLDEFESVTTSKYVKVKVNL